MTAPFQTSCLISNFAVMSHTELRFRLRMQSMAAPTVQVSCKPGACTVPRRTYYTLVRLRVLGVTLQAAGRAAPYQEFACMKQLKWCDSDSLIRCSAVRS